ncbi:FAD/NAD(P)-binding protein [Pseudomonas sp. LB3P14]
MVTPETTSGGAIPLRIGIVGLGSRGLGILERLLALAPRLAPRLIEVTIFEPDRPGSGLHRSDQPDYLLLNTIACQLSVFPDRAAIGAAGRSGPDFYTWCVERRLRLSEDGQVSPDAGRPVEPTDFLPRRLLGEYLHWAYAAITNQLPLNVRLRLLQEQAIDVFPLHGTRGYRLYGSAQTQVDVDRLFVTVGHTGQREPVSADEASLIASVYPLPSSLAAIRAGAVVGIEGFGLASMDTLAALTKGRGGRFVRTEDGLRYLSSGQEPELILYSRGGLPFRARPFSRADRVRHQALFATPAQIEFLREQHEGRQLDFEADLLPLLLAEMRAAYYLACSPQVEASVLQRAFHEDRLDAEFTALAQQWGRFEPLEHLLLTLPALGSIPYAQWVRAFIADDLAESQRGVAASPLKSALEVWRDVAGPELPRVLEKIKSYDPTLDISVRVGASHDLLAEFDREEVDVAIVRNERHRRDAESLFEDRYGWFADLSMRTRGDPMPLVTVDDACGIRGTAIRLLAQEGIQWSDAFIGGGVSTALYAAAAGIGVAPLPTRLAASRLIDVGELFGLPPLPTVEMVMYSRWMDAHTRESLRILAGAFRGVAVTHLA